MINCGSKYRKSARELARTTNGIRVWYLFELLFLTGSATLYRDHVFTFDGNYVFIPKLRGARRRCAYLLARDFYTGNFTILYDGHQLTLKTKGSSVLFDKTGKVILFRYDYQGTCTMLNRSPTNQCFDLLFIIQYAVSKQHLRLHDQEKQNLSSFGCKLEIKVITRNIKQYYSNANTK